MLKEYCKITSRSLLKHKSYTLLNVIGLAAAIASSIIIILYARNELSYDGFHANAQRIQLVYKERNTAQGIVELDDTWFPLSGVMQSQYPSVTNSARITQQSGRWVTFGEAKFSETLTFADPSLFDIFTFPLALGDGSSSLEGRNSMVLSRATAEKYFGAENPIGKTVTVNFSDDYLITGVLQDIPQNSSIRPDIIVPFLSRIPEEQLEAVRSNWGGSFLQTYLLLGENQSAESLQAQFPELVLSLFGEDGANGTNNMKLKLWSLRSYHDRNVNSNTTSYILLAIAFAIILMACVNFINLSVARSLDRRREIGMRKILGAQKNQLIYQFIGESMFISALALLIGAIIASLLLPAFNGLFDLSLSFNLLHDPILSVMLLLVGLIAGLVSGAYPAFVLSNLDVMDSLKGTPKSGPRGFGLRKLLSFLQFSLAIILTTGMIAVWQQIQFMKNQDLNFDPQQVLVIPVRLDDFADQQTAVSRMATFKNQLGSIPGVVSVASSMSVPGNYVNANTFARPEDWQQDEPLRMLVAGADDQYFETYGMKFLEGRNFSRNFSTESSSIILNETAMRDMGWDTAVGKKVNDWTVVGVVEDFHYQSLESDIAAIIHRYGAQDSRNHGYVSIKLGTGDLPATLVALEREWQTLDPSRGFQYYFMDESFENLYRNVDTTSKLIAYFALLSILIAILGALGLASYDVVQRTREIGVRKVLGGSSAQIVLLLTSQFVRPALLANLLAWPLTFVAINQWLQGFANPMQTSWLIFPIGGLCVLVLSMLTVAIQTANAASANPVEALRTE